MERCPACDGIGRVMKPSGLVITDHRGRPQPYTIPARCQLCQGRGRIPRELFIHHTNEPEVPPWRRH